MCNLACPVCETGDGTLGRKDGHLSFDDFKTMIDKIADHTNTLMYYFMGEPFLNKESYRQIRYAKDKGIPWVTTCSNGDAVNPKKLIESGIDEIAFQIGGMSNETHATYRINSKFDRVLKKMEETVALRREMKSPLRIVCGFILMKHNEHEVDTFKKKMAELGIDEAQIIDPCVRTIEQGHKYLPTDRKHWIYEEDAFERGELVPKYLAENSCPWIYYSMSVHVNGDVVPCCRDPKGEEIVGNLIEQDLDEIWNGQKMQDFRARVMNDQGNVGICRLCSSYPASQLK
ncbi:MAG: radical SAM/SPASM domain-containing protein [Minwuia sp.]|uniref:radical SAM/SPASM domain-containing protein n=1 Tax=Minwuia sp. TaxID=2493630 RepID=UPI003A84B1EE